MGATGADARHTAMAAVGRPVIAAIVQQHAEEAVFLRELRTRLVRAPHVGLLQLGRLDERIEAHLDGLRVAGGDGIARLLALLDGAGAGAVFALAVRALETRDGALLGRLLAVVPALDDDEAGWRGLASALGWVPATALQGMVPRLLTSAEPHARAAGLAACRLHRVDPGDALARAMGDPAARVRCEALRCAAATGRTDMLGAVKAAVADGDAETVFEAAWSAVLLGERGAAWQVLAHAAQHSPPAQAERALMLAMASARPREASELARRLSAAAQGTQAAPHASRRMIDALAMLGDARFVPWLVDRMGDPTLARRAGQAWCWITGADLAADDLEARDAPDRPPQPSEEPQDEDVAVDEDEDLPWPDPARVAAWWSRHASSLPTGERLFAGAPVGRDGASRALTVRTQRMRAYAALQLAVLRPGEPLFAVAAPAPRQRRWLHEHEAAR